MTRREAPARPTADENTQASISAHSPDAPMSVRLPVRRWNGAIPTPAEDDVTVEEPLQIRLAGEDVTVTMRTPGHDNELAAGFLFTEGIISGKAHIEEIGPCSDDMGDPAPNIVNVFPTERNLLDPDRWGRNFYANSGCGLCGKTSLDHIFSRSPRLASRPDISITSQILYSLGVRLRGAQETFARTGGMHAAALFDLSGNLLVLREDVGRHNAVDKIIGHALLGDMLPLDRHILLVSSRASFEIVQKAHAAGIPILAAVSAPSSLAVETAQEAGMTLVAFLREGRFNVYCGDERLGDT